MVLLMQQHTLARACMITGCCMLINGKLWLPSQAAAALLLPLLLQASFRQWQLRHALPQLEQRVAELSAAKEAVQVPQEEQVGRRARCCAV
jgi:hypothetical protein